MTPTRRPPVLHSGVAELHTLGDTGGIPAQGVMPMPSPRSFPCGATPVVTCDDTRGAPGLTKPGATKTSDPTQLRLGRGAGNRAGVAEASHSADARLGAAYTTALLATPVASKTAGS